MPNGRMHTATSLVVGVVGAIALAASPDYAHHAMPFAAGALAAVLVQPDLDHPNGYIGYAILRRLPAGFVLAGLWRAYWTPYRWMVGLLTKRTHGAGDSHRSWLSHLPLIGTVGRLVWLLWPVWLAWGWWMPPAAALAAIALCDALHAMLDGVQWGSQYR